MKPIKSSISMKHKHGDCYFCRNSGYLFSGYTRDEFGIRAEMLIEDRHEGWPGIPHGGVGMSALVELADLLHDESLSFPLLTSFRFGGERLVVGDRVVLDMKREGEVLSGAIRKDSGGLPYLTARIESGTANVYRDETERLGELLARPVITSSPLVMPNFANRIVYSPESQERHRYRTFKFKEVDTERVYMKCSVSDSTESPRGSDINLLAGRHLHPGALITILDETLGWAGFFAAWQGGVTVSISACFMRAILPGENIFAMGVCDRMSGSFSRKMVECSGAIFVKNGGIPEPAAYSTGKWLTRPEYKEKMLNYMGSYGS